MSAESQHACPSCGNEFSGAMEFCPVCMLRKAVGGGVESFVPEDGVAPATPEPTTQRFEHYELAMGEDGKPVELGRGAMGVTYKAFDKDLQCPVTLKIISDRYLRDEMARLCFLREARAAARLRHSNVASVLHLGRTGNSYFYAMEFVEGETLEKLIKRLGRLEIKLAAEIATQVAAGLAAVHKQKLVHRDIKPSNVMVNLEEGGAVTAKIIDLGLAKPAPDAPAEAAISTLGAFAGTPEFASPEQFAGVPVDIRSDLYSLGVTLWVMVTGQTPFQGPSAEVMYQHQHIALPLGQLKGLPQPVVALLKVLLEKDPAHRFQSPAELLNAISLVTAGINAGRSVTPQDLRAISTEGLAAFQKGRKFSGGLKQLFTTSRVRLIGGLVAGLLVAGVLILAVNSVFKVKYQFSTIDVPGASATRLNGNSANQIVGQFDDAAGKTHGFVLNNGNFTTIDVPVALDPGMFATIVNGINARGQLVGTYSVGSTNHAFFGNNGNFIKLDPANVYSQGGSINAKGQVVGTYRDSNQYRHGFIWLHGNFTTFNVPGDASPLGTVPYGINDNGDVVGNYVAAGDGKRHGFLRSGEHGLGFTTLDVPGAATTIGEGINNAGTIVGVYVLADGTEHGFVRNNGVFTTIDVPNARGTEINSINAKGEIVGSYSDSQGTNHGFLGVPGP